MPPPGKTGAGRGRGVRRPTPEGSAEQMMRLCQLLSEDRSLERAAFRLWIEGYAVPLERVRTALRALSPNRSHLLRLSGEALSEVAEDYAEKMRAKKSTPMRVKKMADDGWLSTFLTSMLSMGLGQETDPKSLPQFGESFEEYAGLDRARTDHWEGKSPWLTGDMEPQMDALSKSLPNLKPEFVDEATEEEYEQARMAFRSWEKLRRCTELLETLHGENVFGFGMLTKPPIGVSPGLLDPGLFVGMLGFCRADPSLIENMINAGATFETSLASLLQQVNDTNKNFPKF
jgi:hypothetical protein